MSQQINLFNDALKKSKKDFSALNMAQALGVILFCAILFYLYAAYQTRMMEQQLEAINKSIAAEQGRLGKLATEFSQERAGMTMEQQLKKFETEAAVQRGVINALKSGVIGNTRGYSAYMEAFAKQVPAGLWLTGFSIDGDATQMSISGAALNPELVPGYILRLNNEKAMRGKTFASLQMQLPKAEAGKPATTPYLEFSLHSVVAIEPEK